MNSRLINIYRSGQGLRISPIGCEGCYNRAEDIRWWRRYLPHAYGFMAFGLWVEFNFLHTNPHSL